MNYGDDDIQSDEDSDDYGDESESDDEADGGGGSGIFMNRGFNQSGNSSGVFINRGFNQSGSEQKKSTGGVFINRNFNQDDDDDEVQSDDEGEEEEEGEEESEDEEVENNIGNNSMNSSGIFINRGFNNPDNEEIQEEEDEEEEEEGEEENDNIHTSGIIMNRGFSNHQQPEENFQEEESDEEEEEEEGEMNEKEEEEAESYTSEVNSSTTSYQPNLNEDLSDRSEDLLRTLLVATNPVLKKATVRRDAEGFRIPEEDTSYDPNFGNCLYEPTKREEIKLRPTNPSDIISKKHGDKEWVESFVKGIQVAKNKRKVFQNDAGPITPINQILKDYELEMQVIKNSVAEFIAEIQAEEDAGNLKKRRHVYAEIVSNEQDYVINLKLFLKVYVQPMKAYVRPELHSSMNTSVLTIIGINEPFLKDMLKCYAAGKERGQPEPIGLEDLFSRPQTNQAFKLYFTYVLKYTDWLKEIKELLVKDQKFASFCNGVNDKLKFSGKRKTAITSFLPQPYQHICRYKLLLNELLKRTPKSLPEHRGVKRALRKMSKITKFVNEKKKEVRTREKARQMFEKIQSLKDLVHSEILLDADGSVGGKKAELWLFPHCLVIVQGKKATRLNLKDQSLQVNQSKEDTFILNITSSVLGKKEMAFRTDSPAKCVKVQAQIRGQAEREGGHGGQVRELRAGWLVREEGSLLKKWKKRWCVVHSDRSFIVLKEKGGKIKMKESLVDSKYGIKDQKKFTFYIKTKKSSMVFRAEHENEINAWFVALKMVNCTQE